MGIRLASRDLAHGVHLRFGYVMQQRTRRGDFRGVLRQPEPFQVMGFEMVGKAFIRVGGVERPHGRDGGLKAGYVFHGLLHGEDFRKNHFRRAQACYFVE
jgi:hypothetical protein